MPLSLLVIDCDDFKEINDRAGHEFGDTLLREIADVLSRSLPDGADAARSRRRRVRGHAPRRGGRRCRDARRSDQERACCRAHGRWFPAADQRRDLDLSVRRPRPDSASARCGSGALRRQERAGRIASPRSVSSPHRRCRQPVEADLTLAEARRRGRSDSSGSVSGRRYRGVEGDRGRGNRGCRVQPPVQGTRLRGRRDRHALRRGSSATSSSTRPSTRFARCHSVTKRRIGSPTSRSRPTCLRTGRPRAISFADGDVDPAEAFILRELGMNAVLMLPLQRCRSPMGARRALRDAASTVHGGRHRRGRVPRRAGRAPARGRGRRRRAAGSDRASTSFRATTRRRARARGRRIAAVAGQRRRSGACDEILLALELERCAGGEARGGRSRRAGSRARGRTQAVPVAPRPADRDSARVDADVLLRLELGETLFARGDCALTSFDRGALQLDRSELLRRRARSASSSDEAALALR